MRGYESEYERRCMIEYEVAMYVNWLLVTRPPFSPPRAVILPGAENRRRSSASALCVSMSSDCVVLIKAYLDGGDRDGFVGAPSRRADVWTHIH